MNLSGKTILLTGSKRIGSVVAKKIAEKGANLAIAYNSSKEEADKTRQEIISLGGKAEIFQAELAKEEDVKNLVEQAIQKFSSIDGLVHMASPYPKTPLGNISIEDVQKIMNTIAGSAILLGQEAGLHMLKKSDGETRKIIFFSDWSVLTRPSKDYIVYNAAKAAINSITKNLAIEFAPKVTVNAIAPGPILKPPDLTDEEDKEVLARTPLRRWGGEEEIVKAVLYLLDADFTTGVVLPVDGGRTIG